MTDKPIPAPVPPRYLAGGRYWLKRLNFFMRFAHHVDLAILSNGAWEDFLDELFTALYDEKRDRTDKLDIFNRTATRESVREAQRGLAKEIASDKDTATFNLGKGKLIIRHSEVFGYYGKVESEHFPTGVYWTFKHLLEASNVRESDFRPCANDKCGCKFVPLRKTSTKKAAYCSTKCANRVAAIRYRKIKADVLKAKEQARSKNRYRKKVLKK